MVVALARDAERMETSRGDGDGERLLSHSIERDSVVGTEDKGFVGILYDWRDAGVTFAQEVGCAYAADGADGGIHRSAGNRDLLADGIVGSSGKCRKPPITIIRFLYGVVTAGDGDIFLAYNEGIGIIYYLPIQ